MKQYIAGVLATIAVTTTLLLGFSPISDWVADPPSAMTKGIIVTCFLTFFLLVVFERQFEHGPQRKRERTILSITFGATYVVAILSLNVAYLVINRSLSLESAGNLALLGLMCGQIIGSGLGSNIALLWEWRLARKASESK